jgi:hypothetical protein
MALYQKGDRLQEKPSKDEEAKIRELMGNLG